MSVRQSLWQVVSALRTFGWVGVLVNCTCSHGTAKRAENVVTESDVLQCDVACCDELCRGAKSLTPLGTGPAHGKKPSD
eukprot:2046525-Amphidinium_carterae.1